MIDWNTVTVGETEIVSPFNVRQLVAGLHLDNVWLFNPESGDYDSWNKAAFTDCTIYDPWVEVTNECEWVPDLNTFGGWSVWHKKQAICHGNESYKIEPTRVWMRKEGVNEPSKI